jgi:high affinity sulfate transporter 1
MTIRENMGEDKGVGKYFFPTIKKDMPGNLPKDIISGIVIAAVSIPISMGYAQIAGLPAVYGLYGSVFPILFFALFSTSPQMIFGVDAAPAAMIGAVLVSLGIEAGSEEAVRIIPVLTFYTACWLLLFSCMKAGRMVSYISTPVMGGFISGIAVTIILMQIPKFMGSGAGSGELFELLEDIFKACQSVNKISLALGLGSLAILLISKKIMPKFPMAVVMMILGALITKLFHVERYGVTLLSAVETGLPKFSIPDFSVLEIGEGLGMSLTVALVIMAETLLASHNFALKNGYTLRDNQEIFAYAAGNFAAAFTGCCPVNGSVSRTVMGEQFGGKTQAMSVVAGLSMLVLLLTATGFIGYLPVPVLTSIVISALLSVIEFDLAERLWKVSRTEFLIFMGAFLGVLVLGTIFGVLIGVLLSFVEVIIRATNPPRGFLGIIPGRDGFFHMNRNRQARPIEHVVIYRFSGSLFFANIKAFQEDIENSIQEDTKAVIVDAGGISSIDITAADRLDILYRKLKKQGIKFYLTEHIGAINDELRRLGIGYLVEEGAARRTIASALKDAGIEPVVSAEGASVASNGIQEELLHEFEWAFGKDAQEQMEKQAMKILEHAGEGKAEDMLEAAESWHGLSLVDEDEMLEHLQFHMDELAKRLGENGERVNERIFRRRRMIAEHLKSLNPEKLKELRKHQKEFEEELKREHPEAYWKLMEYKRKRVENYNGDKED